MCGRDGWKGGGGGMRGEGRGHWGITEWGFHVVQRHFDLNSRFDPSISSKINDKLWYYKPY